MLNTDDENQVFVTDKDVKITEHKSVFSDAVVNADIYIYGSESVLNNIKAAGTIYIDAGEKGSVNLNNVSAKNIEILSGGEHSIYFRNVTANMLHIKSRSLVRVVSEELTVIQETIINKDCTLEVNKGSFGEISISALDSSYVNVRFVGNFDKTAVVNSQAKIFRKEAKNLKLIINNSDVSVDGSRVSSKTDLDDYEEISVIANPISLVWITDNTNGEKDIGEAAELSFKASLAPCAPAVYDASYILEVYKDEAKSDTSDISIKFNNKNIWLQEGKAVLQNSHIVTSDETCELKLLFYSAGNYNFKLYCIYE